MRMPSRKKESVFQQRREQLRKDRLAAQTLRSAFPAVELVRVELKFCETAPLTPASQSHVVHPPARAFFEYPCPFADCDGSFNLRAMAADAVANTTLSTEGVLECSGVRARDKLQKQPCGLRVNYKVSAQILKVRDPTG